MVEWIEAVARVTRVPADKVYEYCLLGWGHSPEEDDWPRTVSARKVAEWVEYLHNEEVHRFDELDEMEEV